MKLCISATYYQIVLYLRGQLDSKKRFVEMRLIVQQWMLGLIVHLGKLNASMGGCFVIWFPETRRPVLLLGHAHKCCPFEQ